MGARRGDTQAVLWPAPPAIIHLIFDELIGIEGIPPEAAAGNAVRHSLRSFLHENGFRVFGRAYSRFHRTDNAIANMLNYASMPKEAHFIEENPKRIKQNQYFNDMHDKGYRMTVYQPNYIDFCNGHEHQIKSCHTFFAGIKTLERTIIKNCQVRLDFAKFRQTFYNMAGRYRILRKIITQGCELWLFFASMDSWLTAALVCGRPSNVGHRCS